MKLKSITFFVTFSLLSSLIWAQPAPEQNAEFFTRFNTMQDFEPSFFAASGIYNIWGRRFSASGGLLLQKGDSQLTLQASYKFFKHEKLSLATGAIYNLNWLHNYSLSNNFLPYFMLEWKPLSLYTLEVSFDYMLKLRRLFVLSRNHHPLINSTIAFSIKNTFNINEDIKLYFEAASFEKFRYMMFCAPSFIFGGHYLLNQNLTLEFETAIHYIDFFTLSAHYADSDIRLGVKYKW